MTRYYLPGTLAGVLLIFVAPWMELTIVSPPPMPAIPIIRASGLQAAQGSFATLPFFTMVMDKIDREGGAELGLPAPPWRTPAAPLLWGFAASIAVALLATMLMTRGMGRSFMVISCAFVALAFLALQSSHGMPLIVSLNTPDAPRVSLSGRLMPAYYLTWVGAIAVCLQAINEARPRRGYSPFND